jgi:CDP-diacylglycerol--serine O-phosphatidyltransferase
MVLDSLDGRVARMTNTQSAFGEQMDSLSDMVSFGAAPAPDRLRMGAQGPGPLGLDRRLRLLRLRGAAPGALQRQHRRRRQALLPGPAVAGRRGAGDRLHLADDDYQVKPYDVAWPMFAFALYAGLTMVTNVPFYSFKDIQMKKSVPFAVIVLIALGIAVINIDPPMVLFVLFVSTACPATRSTSGARPRAIAPASSARPPTSRKSAGCTAERALRPCATFPAMNRIALALLLIPHGRRR